MISFFICSVLLITYARSDTEMHGEQAVSAYKFSQADLDKILEEPLDVQVFRSRPGQNLEETTLPEQAVSAYKFSQADLDKILNEPVASEKKAAAASYMSTEEKALAAQNVALKKTNKVLLNALREVEKALADPNAALKRNKVVSQNLHETALAAPFKPSLPSIPEELGEGALDIGEDIGDALLKALTGELAVAMGGERDAHGCLMGAGYFWCEAKQGCRRSYDCPEYGQFQILPAKETATADDDYYYAGGPGRRKLKRN